MHKNLEQEMGRKSESGLYSAIKTNLLIAFIVIIPFMNGHSETSKETIIWPYFSYPPMYIVEGKTVKGFGGDIMHLLMNQLTEYHHIPVNAPPVRIFKNIEHGEQYCAIGLVKTPDRERYMHFSRPCRVALPDVVIIRTSDRDRFNATHNISLRRLLQNRDLVMGNIRDASFGPEIDALIARFGKAAKTEQLSGTEATHGLLKMLVSKRTDWFIWDPTSILIVAKKLNLTDQFLMFPIREAKPSISVGYVACPKNEWGRKVIRRIDEVLRRETKTEQYLGYFTPWIPENLLPLFKQEFKRVMTSQ